jgi:hypothetical protein
MSPFEYQSHQKSGVQEGKSSDGILYVVLRRISLLYDGGDEIDIGQFLKL